MNEAELSYCRVDQWHAAGYTGAGVKVAVHEVSGQTVVNFARYGGRVIDAFGGRFGTKKNTHTQRVIDTLLTAAPDVEVHLLGTSFAENLRYCIANGIDVYNYSVDGGANNAEINALEQEALDSGVFLVCAAGNDGENGMSTMARKDSWLSVGAAKLINGVPARMAYSSYDTADACLDVMGFAEGLRVPDEINGGHTGLSGTSFASPWVVGLTALWKQRFIAECGRKPTYEETIGFIRENSTDIGADGYDQETGFGVLRLPALTKEPDYDVIDIYVGRAEAFVNGAPKPLLTSPVILNGRVYVGIADMQALLGVSVNWTQSERKVTIKKERLRK